MGVQLDERPLPTKSTQEVGTTAQPGMSCTDVNLGSALPGQQVTQEDVFARLAPVDAGYAGVDRKESFPDSQVSIRPEFGLEAV